MDIEKLIACVQENKCLWNMRDKHYHNRDVCRQSWEKVASQLDTSSKQSYIYYEFVCDYTYISYEYINLHIIIKQVNYLSK